jgi:hypothetical protein
VQRRGPFFVGVSLQSWHFVNRRFPITASLRVTVWWWWWWWWGCLG